MAEARAVIMNAVRGAARLHLKHGSERLVDRGEGRVDVFRMILDQDIPLVFRPLSGLLGAFINDPMPGVMVTTRRPLAVQRFTAAHELGHALLGHQPSLDDEGLLRRTPFAYKSGYELQEVEADAFATELLVPRWLVTSHVVRQGYKASDLSRAEVVYQLSLRLGVSYSAMCYSLRHHGAIRRTACQALVEIPPREIKESLAEGVRPDSWHGDVWVVTERDEGMLLEGSRTDLVVLRFAEHSGSGYLWRFDELAEAGLKILEDRRVALNQGDQIGGVVARRVTAQPMQGARGLARLAEVRPWLPMAEPLHTVSLRMDLSGPVEAGLPVAERRRLLGVA